MNVFRYGCSVGVAVQWLWLGGMAMGMPIYQARPIDLPPGGGRGAGLGINDAAQIVGSYTRFGPSGQIRRAFLSDAFGATIELDMPESWTVEAVDLNNRGQIALYGGALTFAAYRYTPGIGYEPLGSFGGPFTETDAINDLGQLTGYSEGPDGHARAFRYSDGIGLEYIGGSFVGSRGHDINDLGWVVGTGDGHAFLYRDGEGITDLGPGSARGLNNTGTVVGEALLPTGTSEAFVYRNGQMQRVGQPGGGMASLNDINEAGVAVGTGFKLAEGGILQVTALYWSDATGLIDLNTLLPENSGWYLASATAINEDGQVTGRGIFNGLGIPYRLDLIPEPSTWLLLSFGALALWANFQRKR